MQRILLINPDSLSLTPFLDELSKHRMVEVHHVNATSHAAKLLAAHKFDAIFIHAGAVEEFNDVQLIGERVRCPVYTLAEMPPVEGRRALLHTLSVREKQVFALMVKGLTSSEIGEQLKLSPKTVDTYRSRVRHKLRIENFVQLIVAALRMGIISFDDEEFTK